MMRIATALIGAGLILAALVCSTTAVAAGQGPSTACRWLPFFQREPFATALANSRRTGWNKDVTRRDLAGRRFYLYADLFQIVPEDSTITFQASGVVRASHLVFLNGRQWRVLRNGIIVIDRGGEPSLQFGFDGSCGYLRHAQGVLEWALLPR